MHDQLDPDNQNNLDHVTHSAESEHLARDLWETRARCERLRQVVVAAEQLIAAQGGMGTVEATDTIVQLLARLEPGDLISRVEGTPDTHTPPRGELDHLTIA